MNNNPKITIIIPCKNAEKTIQKTFDSLRIQDYQNLECILMDGKSSDKTMNIVEDNSDILNIIISEEDKSGAAACNKAIKLSTGDIIGFLYADDYLENNSLNEIANAVKKYPDNDIYSYGLSIEDLESKKIIFESFSKKNIDLKLDNILFKHVLNHFYRRNIFKKYGSLTTLYYDGTIFYSNDREFLIRLCLNNLKNYVIEKILYKMTFHENSFTGSRKNIVKIREEHIGIADHYIGNNNLSIYKKKKLIDFKSHNLSLLFIYYVYKVDFQNIKKTFILGFKLKSFIWFVDIFKSPVSELIYRFSVKKW
jgi:glycosyltransferase involved in cell wall biosynthesis